ncbi:hypothetical protein HDU97_002172 [Phlyctochytrium planicorne]|nr:hypothetical protein HDU97_002172 [Phlyctochytrium planicorne]
MTPREDIIAAKAVDSQETSAAAAGAASLQQDGEENAVNVDPAIAAQFPRLNLSLIRKSIPQHLFEKDLHRSLFHLIVDFTVLLACFRAYSQDMSLLSYILYANVTGLFMWCLFVVGHDAGHGTFSDNKWVNVAVGHFSHGFLLVPWWPWAKSHAAHHAFHNHKDKDRGHTWFDITEEGVDKYFKDYPFFIPLSYGVGYLLLGINDGSHYFPWSKLHKTQRDRIECTVSALACFAWFFVLYSTLGKSIWAAYFGPWLIYNTWLYAVTYLQHHMEGTKVYGEETWSFTTGALETVDRIYDPLTGGSLDYVMHNITDGHVAHHLFSTSIPHYNLLEATRYIRPHLGNNYREVVGFPLLELLRDHWFTTRPLLVKMGKGWWRMVKPDEVEKVTKKEE